MININEHVVVIEGIKYVPYSIAMKAINNVFIEGVDQKVEDVNQEMDSLINKLSNIKFDD